MYKKIAQFIKDRQERKNRKNLDDVPLSVSNEINSDNPVPDKAPPKIPLQENFKWQIPNWEQFKFLLKSLSEKEKKIVLGSIFLACVLFATWGIFVYFKDTNRKPALGGSYTEGVQGQPLYINPVVAHSNPVDSDLSKLVFSSLFRYSSEGKLEPDLVSTWERSSDGLTYTVRLRDTAKWHDGKPLTADDVVFTLNLIRNPSYASSLRGNWEGIEVAKVDDYTLTFTLKKAYTPFLHNLTFGILPKHIWGDIASDKFLLTELNRKPVGSGMYTFMRLDKDQNGKITSVTLRSNKEYYGEKPHLNEIIFRFYSTPDEIRDAFSKGEVRGIANIETADAEDIKNSGNINIYEIPTTRIYGIFFNQKKSIVAADKKVREALSHATDKSELLKVGLSNRGAVVNTPLVPNMLGFQESMNNYEYNPDKAISLLKEAGWKELNEKERKKVDSDESEIARYNEKNKKSLTLMLTVPNYPELVKTAELLKKQWEKVGLDLKLDVVDTSETLQNKISERNYDALLFGEVLQADPDPTPFWHSSSKQAPGLNLSMFDNKDVDGILDTARQEVNEEKRAELYKQFQEIVMKETPVIFLFSPYYLYGVSNDFQGVGSKFIFSPSNRLDDIGNRYLYTTRMRK